MNSDAERARSCRIALGSANELDYHLLLSRDLGLLGSENYQRALAGVTQLKKMLAAFIETLTRRADSR